MLYLVQTPFQHLRNGRDLLLYTLVGLIDPEQTFFQFRRTIQRMHAVMSQCASESFNKWARQPFALRVEHAQIRKQVGFRAGFLRAELMACGRFALE